MYTICHASCVYWRCLCAATALTQQRRAYLCSMDVPQPSDEPPAKRSRQQPPPPVIYWCQYCQQLLNGPTQVQDHLVGKRHRRKRREASVTLDNNGISVAG